MPANCAKLWLTAALGRKHKYHCYSTLETNIDIHISNAACKICQEKMIKCIKHREEESTVDVSAFQ